MASTAQYAPIHPTSSPALDRDPSFPTGMNHEDSHTALNQSNEDIGSTGSNGYQKEAVTRAGAAPVASRKRLWIALGGALIVIAAIAIGVGVGVTRNNDHHSDGSGSDHSGHGSPSKPTASATPLPATGGDNSLVTMENGQTFTYRNPYGGHWVATPFDNSARAQNDVPPLNEEWDFETNRIDGVNVGGWLVTEPFISPALFEPYLGTDHIMYDEYDLSVSLGNRLADTLTQHYDTFITEEDFALMAGYGLNWIRFPVPWWMIETIAGEPHLEGAQFPYFVKALNWARKYGIRIMLDLHAVPGSQNGWNHSGRSMGGALGFLGGNMGVVNAERTLNYLRTLIQFVSQPQYAPIVPLSGIINEPRQNLLGDLPMRSFYYQAYNEIRQITGVGRGHGPLLLLADGFGAVWQGFMTGADRIGLDHHFYQAFDEGGNQTPLAGQITRSCNGNGGTLNGTMTNFGFAVVGEWSIAMNDCGQFVTAVNDGTRYQGNFSEGTNAPIGSCSPFTDWWTWDDNRKAGFADLYRAGADAARNTFFWTWTIGNSTWTNRPANPMWNYKLGVQQGYIPANPRDSHGACASLAGQYGFALSAATPVPTPMPASRVGDDPNARPTDTNANYVAWPPAGDASISPSTALVFTNLPRYTPTGTPITLTGAAAPTVSGHSLPTNSAVGTNAGNGWANPSATGVGWYTPVAGCSYLGPYDGFNTSVPAACGATAAAAPAKRSPVPVPEPTAAPAAVYYDRKTRKLSRK